MRRAPHYLLMAEREDANEQSEASPAAGRLAPYVFLIGLVAFVGSLLAFVADLVTGYDVLRSLFVNAGATLVLVGWAAYDTLYDPDSEVDSAGGAAGTAALLYGLYLLLAGVVVAATSLWHDQFGASLLAGAAGLTLVVTGIVVFPHGSVLDDGDGSSADGSGQKADTTPEE
jgi:hypothetical protein